jgi:ATP-binding cassette, subfamily B (MDR/TAP), member 1
VNVVIDFWLLIKRSELNRFDLHGRVIAFTFMTAQASLLESAAGIMTRDMKNKWFQALLRQDMAFYDIKDVSGTASIISSNGQVFKK